MGLLGLPKAVPPATALVCWFESYQNLVDHLQRSSDGESEIAMTISLQRHGDHGPYFALSGLHKMTGFEMIVNRDPDPLKNGGRKSSVGSPLGTTAFNSC
jgi:hypothetical protein